jgi:hypothetical protein
MLWQRQEELNPPIDRGLTARPVVLAKNGWPGTTLPL